MLLVQEQFNLPVERIRGGRFVTISDSAFGSLHCRTQQTTDNTNRRNKQKQMQPRHQLERHQMFKLSSNIAINIVTVLAFA